MIVTVTNEAIKILDIFVNNFVRISFIDKITILENYTVKNLKRKNITNNTNAGRRDAYLILKKIKAPSKLSQVDKLKYIKIINYLKIKYKLKSKKIFEYKFEYKNNKIIVPSLNSIITEKKTDFVKKYFKYNNYYVEDNWNFESYDKEIYFYTKLGKFKNHKLKKTWKSIKKYPQLNISSLCNPTKFIIDYLHKQKLAVKKDWKYINLSKKVIFYPIFGPYKKILMAMGIRRILEGYKPDSRHIINKKKYILQSFTAKGFVISNKYLDKIDDNSLHNKREIIFYPKVGKYKNFKFKSTISRVIFRNAGTEFKNLFNKEEYIQHLIPGYKINSKIDFKTKSEKKINLLCPRQHIWKTKISNILTGRKCLHCAAAIKNLEGGSSYKNFSENSFIANKQSYMYLVLFRGNMQNHLKIGIANNIKKRGGEKYDKVYFKFKASRAECWVAESYLKKLTHKARSGYKEKNFEGWTELRDLNKINMKKLLSITKELINIINNIGWEKFYNEYLKKSFKTANKNHYKCLKLKN